MAQNNNGIRQWQIAKIHIAKTELNISSEDYQLILANFKNYAGLPCTSSKEFTYKQAEVLLDIFHTRFGWKEARKYKESKYAQYAGRNAKFATVAQLELIDYKWYSNINVREKTDKALNNYIKTIIGIDHISFLLKKDVSRVLKAIISISAKSDKGGNSEI